MCCAGVPDEFKKATYRGGTNTGSAGFAGGNQYGHDWKTIPQITPVRRQCTAGIAGWKPTGSG